MHRVGEELTKLVNSAWADLEANCFATYDPIMQKIITLYLMQFYTPEKYVGDSIAIQNIATSVKETRTCLRLTNSYFPLIFSYDLIGDNSNYFFKQLDRIYDTVHFLPTTKKVDGYAPSINESVSSFLSMPTHFFHFPHRISDDLVKSIAKLYALNYYNTRVPRVPSRNSCDVERQIASGQREFIVKEAPKSTNIFASSLNLFRM